MKPSNFKFGKESPGGHTIDILSGDEKTQLGCIRRAVVKGVRGFAAFNAKGAKIGWSMDRRQAASSVAQHDDATRSTAPDVTAIDFAAAAGKLDATKAQPLKRAATKPNTVAAALQNVPPAPPRTAAQGEFLKQVGKLAKGKTTVAAAAAAVIDRSKDFFGGKDNDAALLAPGVYRESSGSHTTILLATGRTQLLHVPMDAAGLRVVKTDMRQFRRDFVRAPYPVAEAAAKYLKVTQFEIAPRARAALEAVAKGGDEKAVRAALARTQEPSDEAAAKDASLAGGLVAAGKASAKQKKSTLPKGRGIGAWVMDQLLAKVDDAKILADVAIKFPGAKTNAAHLAWYRGKLKRDGKLK